jgi:hypothetical protein
MAAVTSISSRNGAGLAEAVAGKRSACRALTVAGAAKLARGDHVQNHTAAITTAETTPADIRPNALRIARPSKKTGNGLKRALMRTRS